MLAVGWLPVVVHELSSRASNVGALAATARAPGASIGLAFVAERLAAATAPMPLFARPAGRFDFLADAHPVQVVAASLIFATVGAVAVLFRRDPRLRSAGVLAALVLASSASAALASSRAPALSAVRADGMRWLWVTSLVTWLVLIWSGWRCFEHGAPRPVHRWALPVAGALCVLVLGAGLLRVDVRSQRDGAVMDLTAALADGAIASTSQGPYLLTFDGPQALSAIGPGIAVRLEDAGRPVVVEAGEFSRGYGPHRTGGDAAVLGKLRVSTDRFATAVDGEHEIASAELTTDGTSTIVRLFLSR